MTYDHERSSEGLITVARALMRESSSSWRSLAGRLELREDEALLDEGRKRYHGLAAMDRSVSPDVKTTGYAFSVIRAPLRMRLQIEHPSTAADPESAPELIICRDQTCWAKTGAEVINNKANPMGSLGLFGLEYMLSPDSIADIMDCRKARETLHERRPAIAVWTGASEMTWQHAPTLVVLSVDRYELHVDRDLGILLTSRAYIDNRIARDITLHNIRVDPPLDAEADFDIPV